MGRPFGLMAVAGLGVLQGILGLVRGFELFRLGIDLTDRGVLILPLLGMMTAARGGLVAFIALLYLAFAFSALAQGSWAWWLGMAAGVVNLLLVVNAIAQGASVVQALVWAVVPVILLLYLCAPAGRQALND